MTDVYVVTSDLIETENSERGGEINTHGVYTDKKQALERAEVISVQENNVGQVVREEEFSTTDLPPNMMHQGGTVVMYRHLWMVVEPTKAEFESIIRVVQFPLNEDIGSLLDVMQ